jgi:hypothetical protein
MTRHWHEEIVDKDIPNTAPLSVKKIRNPNWNRDMSVDLTDYKLYQKHFSHIGFATATDEFLLLRTAFSPELLEFTGPCQQRFTSIGFCNRQ